MHGLQKSLGLVSMLATETPNLSLKQNQTLRQVNSFKLPYLVSKIQPTEIKVVNIKTF